MKRMFIIFLSFVTIVALVLAVLIYLANKATPGMAEPKIESFSVNNSDFIIIGKYLSQADLWYIPTKADTNSTGAIRIGSARLQTSDSAGNQTWTYPIPAEPLPASRIFANGLGSDNKKAKDLILDITGETILFNTIWYSASKSPMIGIWDNSRIFSYAINDKFAVMLEESKYPQNNLTVDPIDLIIESTEKQPEVPLPFYVVGFKVLKAGTSTIANGDFIIHINTYLDNGNRIYKNSDYGFSFDYPPTGILNDNSEYEYITGRPLARVDLSRNDFIDTNLSEASFMVGASQERSIVEKCKKISDTQQMQTDDKTINNVLFKVFYGNDAAAGNRYDTYGYRTVQDDTCYEIELLIHYGNIDNYETGTVKEFNREKAKSDLMEILDSFEIDNK